MILYLISVVVSLLLIKLGNIIYGKFLNSVLQFSPIWAVVVSVIPGVNVSISLAYVIVSLFIICVEKPDDLKRYFNINFDFDNNKVYEYLCKLISYNREK